MATCNCSNIDDDSPCSIHTPKLARPEIVNHSVIVIRLYRRTSNKKWFTTKAIDAIQTSISPELDSKKEALDYFIRQ